MTYRDDLDALSARHTNLQLEIGRKQRELAEVAGMLADAHRLDQAESHFGRVPALRRRERRHLVAGALAVSLCLGAGLSYATNAVADSRVDTEHAVNPLVAKIEALRTKHERTQRLKAEIEALQTLGLIPIVDPGSPRGKRWVKTSPMPAWTLGSPLPARGTLWPVSTAISPAGKDKR
jgi:hypothetical protein